MSSAHAEKCSNSADPNEGGKMKNKLKTFVKANLFLDFTKR